MAYFLQLLAICPERASHWLWPCALPWTNNYKHRDKIVSSPVVGTHMWRRAHIPWTEKRRRVFTKGQGTNWTQRHMTVVFLLELQGTDRYLLKVNKSLIKIFLSRTLLPFLLMFVMSFPFPPNSIPFTFSLSCEDREHPVRLLSNSVPCPHSFWLPDLNQGWAFSVDYYPIQFVSDRHLEKAMLPQPRKCIV